MKCFREFSGHNNGIVVLKEKSPPWIFNDALPIPMDEPYLLTQGQAQTQ